MVGRNEVEESAPQADTIAGDRFSNWLAELERGLRGRLPGVEMVITVLEPPPDADLRTQESERPRQGQEQNTEDFILCTG